MQNYRKLCWLRGVDETGEFLLMRISPRKQIYMQKYVSIWICSSRRQVPFFNHFYVSKWGLAVYTSFGQYFAFEEYRSGDSNNLAEIDSGDLKRYSVYKKLVCEVKSIVYYSRYKGQFESEQWFKINKFSFVQQHQYCSIILTNSS